MLDAALGADAAPEALLSAGSRLGAVARERRPARANSVSVALTA
jgi:hypothetical protein